MKKLICLVILVCSIGSVMSCDEWPAPWVIIVDEAGNPIPKTRAVCEVPDKDLTTRFSDEHGKLVAPYTRGDVKCKLSKDGYEPVTAVFVLGRERKFDDPERIILKKR